MTDSSIEARPAGTPRRSPSGRPPTAQFAKIVAAGLTATAVLGLTTAYGWSARLAPGGGAAVPAPAPAAASPAPVALAPVAAPPAAVPLAVPVPPAAAQIAPAAQAAPVAQSAGS